MDSVGIGQPFFWKMTSLLGTFETFTFYPKLREIVSLKAIFIKKVKNLDLLMWNFEERRRIDDK